MKITANTQQPGWVAAHEGSHLELRRTRPGELTCASTGDIQFVVGHVSLYIDAVWHVGDDGRVSPARWHCAYRFGDQGESVEEALEDKARALVQWMVEALVSQHGDAVGTTTLTSELDDLLARYEAARRELESASACVERLERRAERTSTSLASARAREELTLREHGRLRDEVTAATR